MLIPSTSLTLPVKLQRLTILDAWVLPMVDSLWPSPFEPHLTRPPPVVQLFEAQQPNAGRGDALGDGVREHHNGRRVISVVLAVVARFYVPL